ncbi:hypothetical protein FB470_003034 [Amycolatopsis thermophila]|uniref:Uncharacterized protein n=1 Tax=Amycolatopsis thermophila TaxID=206084 RepID=A0ABU0EUQ0_9PSEU|nr:hypothetical protein [Amycolatopsis thermophila]
MLAIADPSARFRLIWIRSRRAARTAASVSGSSTSSAITTPTTACGNPAWSTALSIAGETASASPTTATRATSRNARLNHAVPVLGGSAYSSASCFTGRK